MIMKTFCSRAAICAALLFSCVAISHAEVKPGDDITPQNAPVVKDLVSPGTYFAVTKGMGMHIVAPKRSNGRRPTKSRPNNILRRCSCRRTIGPSRVMLRGNRFHCWIPTIPYIATKDNVELEFASDRNR